ncbi:MAG: hypothetical protein Q9209_006130 [Squamulea sp. 1 TL-2023]
MNPFIFQPIIPLISNLILSFTIPILPITQVIPLTILHPLQVSVFPPYKPTTSPPLPQTLPQQPNINSPLSRRRRNQNRRTSRLARSIRTIARNDSSRDSHSSSDSPECEARAAVACYDDGGASGLADAVGGWAGGGEGEDGEEGEEGEEGCFWGGDVVEWIEWRFAVVEEKVV